MKDETTSNMNDETMESSKETKELDPNWAHDALQELEDWIESQGIYIRQQRFYYQEKR